MYAGKETDQDLLDTSPSSVPDAARLLERQIGRDGIQRAAEHRGDEDRHCVAIHAAREVGSDQPSLSIPVGLYDPDARGCSGDYETAGAWSTSDKVDLF